MAAARNIGTGDPADGGLTTAAGEASIPADPLVVPESEEVDGDRRAELDVATAGAFLVERVGVEESEFTVILAGLLADGVLGGSAGAIWTVVRAAVVGAGCCDGEGTGASGQICEYDVWGGGVALVDPLT
ncbi:MAG: hypothetical protein ABJB98_08685 [Actinomycetota bacterium]